MRILSFETATYSGGVALLTPEATLCAGPFDSRSSSREVLSAAQRLLEEAGCALSDVDAVGVSTGPGLFTGVRIGMALAQTLSFAGGAKPVLTGVSTLEAVAAQALATPSELLAGDLIAAVTDARRGEVYAALFELLESEDGPRAVRRGEDIVARPDLAASRLLPQNPALEAPRAIWLVGDGAIRYQDVLLPAFGTSARPAKEQRKPLALVVAELALRQIASGDAILPGGLRPHYVRRPDARLPMLTPSVL